MDRRQLNGATAFVRRAGASVRRRLRTALYRRRAQKASTYSSQPWRQANRLFVIEPDWTAWTCIPRDILDRYVDHQFDLLGSGWTRVVHGMACRGLEGHRFSPVEALALERRVNPANVAESRRIAALIDAAYVAIDWQLDFRSGYRWNEDTWGGDIVFGNVLGADVKVPWELARMQHLPQMALSYAIRRDTAVLREFRNQALDFIAANPPGFGVNWASTMDVAIRAANLVVAFEILTSASVSFDPEFLAIFQNSMWDHARHIVQNPERYGDIRANHYLANVVGFIFVAAWLPTSSGTKAWLERAGQQLVEEMGHQFNPDGTNFEGSTAYHRLSGEMIIDATAALVGRGMTFPDWYLERLERIAEFARDVTKPDGSMHQVGDNDSGRFFKVDRVGNPLDIRHIVGAVGALIERPDFSAQGNDALLVRAFAGKTLVRQPLLSVVERRGQARLPVLHGSSKTIVFASEEPLTGICVCAYPDFGLYIFRSKSFYAAVVCRGEDWRGPTGHKHNDQLALELSIGHRNLIRDPGSYVYTPLPEMRNSYRSVHAHFTPWCSAEEPASLDDGLFHLESNGQGVVHYCEPDGFVGELMIGGLRMTREIRFSEDEVTVIDWCNIPATNRERKYVPFSSGYGVVEVDRH